VSLTVALLAGGRSSEHDVSLACARAVREGLERWEARRAYQY
jgi:D-alanine-D-alanine ligase-like ATP-grasp enzyme